LLIHAANAANKSGKETLLMDALWNESVKSNTFSELYIFILFLGSKEFGTKRKQTLISLRSLELFPKRDDAQGIALFNKAHIGYPTRAYATPF